MTGGNQRAQIIREIRHIGIADQDVKGVIDSRPARGTCRVIGYGVAQALALGLCCKGNHACGATHRRRSGGGRECVGVEQAHARHLFDMGVRIDAAGGDDQARGVNFLRAGQPMAQGRNPPTGDGDIGWHDCAARNDAPAGDECFKAHDAPLTGAAWAWRGGLSRPALMRRSVRAFRPVSRPPVRACRAPRCSGGEAVRCWRRAG